MLPPSQARVLPNERSMTRAFWSIAACLAASLPAYALAADAPAAGDTPVIGEMVDGDVPATYRLPPVAVKASDHESMTPDPTVAGSPPDDGHGMAGHSSARGGVTAPGDDATSTQEGRIDVAARDRLVDELEDAPLVRAAAYAPVPADFTEQLLPAVQRGFSLAQRGAFYAARTEFVQVLRRIAQVHDMASGSSDHSRALAAGLRAIDEAEDFVPEGVQLEAELDVRIVASSHRTSVLPEEPGEVLPFEAAAMYHKFAEGQLRDAVAGEQAGSMALYGLGVIYTKLAERGNDDVQFSRCAMTMHGAALGACPQNHLAANELGVLVCRSGRAQEAVALFQHTINFAPTAVAYHNLAVAQERLGLFPQAAANEAESQRLAAWERSRGEVSRRAGVRWVTPEEMARASQPVNRTAEQQAAPAAEPPKSAWQKVVDSTKSLRPGGPEKPENLGPVPVQQVARPMGMPAEQTRWR